VRARGYRTYLAGVGNSNLAAWLSAYEMKAAGVDVEVMAETGMVGYLPRPAEPFVFSFRNFPSCKMLTDILHVMGIFMGGGCGDHHALAGIRRRLGRDRRRQRFELGDPGIGVRPPLDLHDPRIAELGDIRRLVGDAQHPLANPRLGSLRLSKRAAQAEDKLEIFGVRLQLRHVHAVHPGRVRAERRLHDGSDVLAGQLHQLRVTSDELR